MDPPVISFTIPNYLTAFTASTVLLPLHLPLLFTIVDSHNFLLFLSRGKCFGMMWIELAVHWLIRRIHQWPLKLLVLVGVGVVVTSSSSYSTILIFGEELSFLQLIIVITQTWTRVRKSARLFGLDFLSMTLHLLLLLLLLLKLIQTGCPGNKSASDSDLETLKEWFIFSFIESKWNCLHLVA